MRFKVEVMVAGMGNMCFGFGHLDVVVRGIEDDLDGEGESEACELAKYLGYRYVNENDEGTEVRAIRMPDQEDATENAPQEVIAEVVGGEGEVFLQVPKGTVATL